MCLRRPGSWRRSPSTVGAGLSGTVARLRVAEALRKAVGFSSSGLARPVPVLTCSCWFGGSLRARHCVDHWPQLTVQDLRSVCCQGTSPGLLQG